MSETAMNAAQRQQYEEAMTKHLQLAIDRMQLRKWSMEQALGIFRSPDLEISFKNPIVLAQAIYDFVAAGAGKATDSASG